MKKKPTSKAKSKIWLKILKTIALSITILTLAYYVLLLVVPYVHPSHIRIIAWIGLTMPFAVLAVFVWLIIWIIARQRETWITIAVILLVTFPIWRRTIVVNIGGDYPSKEEIAEGHQLKILTYNVEMYQHISITMSQQSQSMFQFDSTKPQFTSFYQSMDIISESDSYLHYCFVLMLFFLCAFAPLRALSSANIATFQLIYKLSRTF